MITVRRARRRNCQRWAWLKDRLNYKSLQYTHRRIAHNIIIIVITHIIKILKYSNNNTVIKWHDNDMLKLRRADVMHNIPTQYAVQNIF